jgi:hypothetical protein
LTRNKEFFFNAGIFFFIKAKFSSIA